MKDWIEKYFSESWEDIQTDIDFSKYEPISISSSLHICEKRYVIDSDTYRLLSVIDSDEYSVEKLKK